MGVGGVILNSSMYVSCEHTLSSWAKSTGHFGTTESDKYEVRKSNFRARRLAASERRVDERGIEAF